MMTRRTGIVCMIALGAFAGRAPFAPAQVASSERLNLGLRGVYFVENQGQWNDASVEYGFKTRGLDIAFRESSFTMLLARERSEPFSEPGCVSPVSEPGRVAPTSAAMREAMHSSDRIRSGSLDAAEYEHLTLTITFPGSNPATPRGAQPQAAKFNYYIGDDESRWASNIPSFGAIIYENLYDGVDLTIAGNDDGVLKYEFQVEPGADWNQIRIAYDGIDSLCVNETGDLEIATAFGTLTDSAPLVWQEADASRTDIPARFELINESTYRFALDGPVDPTRKLIIDPELDWMIYVGGSQDESIYDVAVDDTDHVLATGFTTSTDFTGSNNSYRGGVHDAFVVKVSSSGEVIWMTYLGGGRNEIGYSIAIDAQGNTLVSGDTSSTDFAGRINSHHGGFNDAFVLTVSPSGRILSMAYFGGSGEDRGYGIGVDNAGQVLVAGWTTSLDFTGRANEHHGGGADAFVLKAGLSGQVEWMTYLGGTGWEGGYGMAVDSAGSAVVAGDTLSTDFDGAINSHHGDFTDAFALKVSSAGQVEWMLYLGGSREEFGAAVAVDSSDSVLVTGDTFSTDFEGRRNSYEGRGSDEDAFALKISPSGQLQWMLYLGGSGSDFGYDIAADADDYVFVTGTTLSYFIGRINDRIGELDAFTLFVSPSGQLQWMTYLGGAAHEWGYGIALDNEGHALVAGLTNSTDFSARQNTFRGGNYDAFIYKLHIPRHSVSATCPGGGPIRVSWRGATPGGTVAVLWSNERGSFRLPRHSPCPETSVSLGYDQRQLVFRSGAGPQGTRTVSGIAPAKFCGGYMQLLDIANCRPSNVVRIE